MNISSILYVIQTIVVLIIVIALANISLKFANKYMIKQSKIIKVIERVSVNNNSALSVVNICGTYYLMSLTSGDNKILKELAKEEVESIIEQISKEQSSFVKKDLSVDTINKYLIKKINDYFGMRKRVD